MRYVAHLVALLHIGAAIELADGFVIVCDTAEWVKHLAIHLLEWWR